MDNKLRIKRVKAGIGMLENDIDPSDLLTTAEFKEFYGLSEDGASILICCGLANIEAEMKCNGFIYQQIPYTRAGLLHNWKRFLELIENIK